MKFIRRPDGLEQPFFEPKEIDQTCVIELRKVGLLPDQPEPIRIDQFIEKRFKIVPDYDSLPEGVMGYTEFDRNGVARIVISRELAEDDSPVAQRRVRTTLAHEAGHGLLHAFLFGLSAPNAKLFGAENCAGHQVLCREIAHNEPAPRHKKSAWSEFQANRAIGGLLLPTRLVSKALEPFMVSAGSFGGATLDPSRRIAAQQRLSEVFDVNGIVAKIRIDEMMGQEMGGQQLL